MDLLLQEDGEKELSARVKPLMALGYTERTGCGLFPAPDHLHRLVPPLSPTVVPEKVRWHSRRQPDLLHHHLRNDTKPRRVLECLMMPERERK